MKITLISLLTLVICATTYAQNLTEPRVKEIPPAVYFCTSKKLTMPEVPAFAPGAIDALYAAAEKAKLKVRGPLMMTYNGFTGDASKPFTLEVCVPVVGKTTAASDREYYFMDTSKLKCASSIYQGPMKGIKQAWQDFMGKIFAAGMKPGEDSREVYLYFEKADAENDITELQQSVN